jgi:ElaB/YqjD/DUF883 family membrane-anchored ribosome-binding protein
MTDHDNNRSPEDQRSPEEIERDLARTRAEVSSTLEAIQTKLAPSQMKDKAYTYAREHAIAYTRNSKPYQMSENLGKNLTKTIREHPFESLAASTVIGIGLAWLLVPNRKNKRHGPRRRTDFYSGRRALDYDSYDSPSGAVDSSADSRQGTMQRVASTISEKGHKMKERASETGHNMMDKTSELGHRLSDSTSSVAESARTLTHDASDRGADVLRTIRENPVPAALIGAGIAWLVVSSQQGGGRGSSQSTYTGRNSLGYNSYGTDYSSDSGQGTMQRMASTVSQKGQDLKQRVSETGRNLMEKASELGHRISDSTASMTERARGMTGEARGRMQETTGQARARAEELSQRSQQKYYRAKSSMSNMIQEQPLMVGILGLAAGTLVGALMPSTRREDELMGRTRDGLIDKAKETAREQAEKVKQSAQHVAEVAKSEAEKVASEASSSITQGAQEAAKSEGKPGQQPSLH